VRLLASGNRTFGTLDQLMRAEYPLDTVGVGPGASRTRDWTAPSPVPQSSSASRRTAGAAGFLNFSQSRVPGGANGDAVRRPSQKVWVRLCVRVHRLRQGR
jgi:hypothetical protein